MLYTIKRIISALTPRFVFSWYHLLLAYLGAFHYNFPSRELTVIAVTGTKGKTSTTEYLNAIFEAAGKKTALINGIRFKIGDTNTRNLSRMSMPGRFTLQKLLREAVASGCDVAVVEMTSEGAAQHRHRFIELDALVFTNLSPEHIESHGTLEKYIRAKLSIGEQLARSQKRPRIMVVNGQDPVSTRFLTLPSDKQVIYNLKAVPHTTNSNGGTFSIGDISFTIHFPGLFSLENALAATETARMFGVPPEAIARGLSQLSVIPGRTELVDEEQPFRVYVDYAHNPSSFEALFSSFPNERTICVIGSTGGGRDTWKRPEMGKIAEMYCDEVVVTNEDPYDEEPQHIIDEIVSGMTRTPHVHPDRRNAIHHALSFAKPGDVVLITGKGTDPDLRTKNGKKIPWSDVEVAREELRKILNGS